MPFVWKITCCFEYAIKTKTASRCTSHCTTINSYPYFRILFCKFDKMKLRDKVLLFLPVRRKIFPCQCLMASIMPRKLKHLLNWKLFENKQNDRAVIKLFREGEWLCEIIRIPIGHWRFARGFRTSCHGNGISKRQNPPCVWLHFFSLSTPFSNTVKLSDQTTQ